MTLDQLARALRVSPEQIDSWERGGTRPPFGKAQLLANRLRIPFGYLFLSDIPAETTPLPDLRTLDGAAVPKPSPDFLDLLNEVIVKQQWYREYLEQTERPAPEFVGHFSTQDDVGLVAADMRMTLSVNEQLRRASANWSDFLRRLVHNCEAAGILVMRSGIVAGNTRRKLSVDEFRGFAMSDEVAPLVFINARDSKAAQIFTLAHEVAHIWIGRSGISNPDPASVNSHDTNRIEQFCNSVAAELLVPAESFLNTWRDLSANPERPQKLAARYRVSTMVVLRRALELNQITPAEFIRSVQAERKRQRDRDAQHQDESGGNFYTTLPARNSPRFTDAVLGALKNERVAHLEAAKLLGIRVATLSKLMAELLHR